MTISEIVIASGNKGKVAEFEKMLADLGVSVKSLSEFGEITEFEENGSTFQENARGKAEYYSKILGKIVIADDSGLEVDFLHGRPGVHSARFAGIEGDGKDQANNEKLLSELNGVPLEQRTARFRCSLCMAAPEKMLLEASGSIEGRIGFEFRGSNGFGYDPLFIVDQLGKTAAELEYKEKNEISHRGNAMKAMMKELPQILGRE